MQRKIRLSVLVLAFAASVAAHAATAPIDSDLLAGLRARSIGPAGMSGRVAVIDAVESDPSTIWVGSASGGVWKSTDGGNTWQPMFDDQPVASIGALAIDQRNPDVVWVGTGEGNLRNSVSIGNGVYRTLDGGRTWKHLGLEGSERIHRIVLHPSNPDVAWVAALGRLWGDGTERGVYKTEDGGRTWNRVLAGDASTGASDLVIDPKNPDKLFASLYQFRRQPWTFRSGGPGSGLYVSHDGGRTWQRRTEDDGLPKGDLGRIGLAVSRSNPETVYAMVEARKSALLRSDDGGRTWKTVNDRYDVNPRPFYFGDIRVDPVWPNRVYTMDYDIRVSEDGGRTFAKLVDGSLIHGDFHTLWIDPRNPDLMMVGGDGGIGISHDRGRTARFVANLPLAQYYHVAVDMQTPYNIYGGLQDNGSWKGPGEVWQLGGIRNHHWVPVGYGDGFETLPDQSEPGTVYALWQGGNLLRWEQATGLYRDSKPSPPDGVRLRFNWNAGLATDPFKPGTIYLGSQFLHKSTDRGESWTTISPDLTSNNPEWQKQDESGGLTPDVTGAENHTTIIAIAPSPLREGVIWVGSDDGRIHVTRDGGKTWDSVEKNLRGVPANTWVPEIRASKHDPASAFVVLDNHRRSDFAPYVYRTDDWGKTWKSLVTSDLRGYAHTIEQDPVDPDLLFLGTELGLWASVDAGGRWMRWKHGLPTVSVMDLAIHPREHDLVIATHGRGLYVLDDIRPLRELSAEVLRKPLHVFVMSEAQQHSQRAEDGGFALGASEFRGENPPYGALLTWSLNAPGLPHPIEVKERERKEKERAEKRKATGTSSTTEPAGTAESTAPRRAPSGEDEPVPGGAPEAALGAQEETPDSGPKVEIRITDASGQVVRTFKAPAVQGVNRTVWDLGRDGFKRFPQDPQTPPGDDNPSGPELPPGTYGVTVKYGEQEAQGSLRLLPEPTIRNTEADWQAREAAIRRTGELQGKLADAVEFVRSTRSDVDLALERVRRQRTDKETETAAEKPLREAATRLRQKLDQVERRLWQPYDTVGIAPEKDAFTRLAYVQGYIGATWYPPSPTHQEFLRQAEVGINQALAEVDALAPDLDAFRRQVEAAGVRLLPARQ